MKMTRMLFALLLVLSLVPVAVRADDEAKDKAERGARTMIKAGDVSAALEANERKVQEAFKNKDMKSFMMFVDANGWQADPSGFGPASAAGDMMKDFDVHSYTIENFRANMIDKDAYVVMY